MVKIRPIDIRETDPNEIIVNDARWHDRRARVAEFTSRALSIFPGSERRIEAATHPRNVADAYLPQLERIDAMNRGEQ